MNKNLIALIASGVVLVAAPAIGVGTTAMGVSGAFGETAQADPSQKARVLAEGISDSMNATVYGIAISMLALVSVVIFAVRVYRDSKGEGGV